MKLRLSTSVSSDDLSRISGLDPMKDLVGVSKYVEQVLPEVFEIIASVMTGHSSPHVTKSTSW